MPAIPSVLSALVTQQIDASMAQAGTGIQNYQGPLAQENPSFFVLMCTALGTGIATGTPTIPFTSQDTGFMGIPPIPGVGSGIGVIVNAPQMSQLMYTMVREAVIAQFGETEHDPWPPASDNLTGQFLKALTDGLSGAIKTHYATCWTLVSADPTIYAGQGAINPGQFTGLIPTQVAQQITAVSGPLNAGKFWPNMVVAISEAYCQAIMQYATGSVTIIGVCVPSVTQVCGIPSAGIGIGAAT